ncbi:MAG: ABC transporter ATP-binding protein [Elusimicrobiales bacterium]|nr:ABC transporter ATP-binding protein [Elusimicrobiales bacterium]
MIKLKGLGVKLAAGFSLRLEELHIKAGETFAIIGPNGAGKTTLLNALALLQEAKAESLEIAGQNALNPANRLALRRSMSYLFSRPYLAAGSVYENIVLPLKFRGIADTGQAAKMLELFKIAHLRDRDSGQLSQGERHRVSLARAFVTGPKLVLLDEPFSSLDARVKESITADLSAITRSSGTTLVLVTQDQEEALALADTLAVLKGGALLQRGTPQEIFARPASEEVADFVGVETVIPGEVTGTSDNLCAVRAGGRDLEVVSSCAPGDKVLVCVRPEAVSVSAALEHSSARNHFKGKITSAVPWRLEYKLTMDCGFTVVAAVTKRSMEELGLKPGAEVYASFKATAAHLIKRAT